MTNIKELLGSNIRAFRNDLGFSLERLAEKVDTAANYLGLIERGKKFPSAKMIERIAAALGKDSCDLFARAPVQKDWKEKLLVKIKSLIEEELKTVNQEKK